MKRGDAWSANSSRGSTSATGRSSAIAAVRAFDIETGEQIQNNFYQKTAPQMFERNCANEAELLEGAWAPTSCDKGAERSTGKAP
jgi:hypothetical protein